MSRLIGIGAIAVATVAMLRDHWLASDAGIDDPVTFFASVGACAVLAVVLFARVIPGTERQPDATDSAARQAIACSILGLVSVPAIFLGFPVILGAAGIALGLIGREGPRRKLAIAAIVIGTLPVIGGAIYAIEAGDNPEAQVIR